MGGECYHHCIIPTPIHQAKCNIAKLNGLSSFFVRIHKWISKLRCLNYFFQVRMESRLPDFEHVTA